MKIWGVFSFIDELEEKDFEVPVTPQSATRRERRISINLTITIPVLVVIGVFLGLYYFGLSDTTGKSQGSALEEPKNEEKEEEATTFTKAETEKKVPTPKADISTKEADRPSGNGNTETIQEEETPIIGRLEEEEDLYLLSQDAVVISSIERLDDRYIIEFKFTNNFDQTEIIQNIVFNSELAASEAASSQLVNGICEITSSSYEQQNIFLLRPGISLAGQSTKNITLVVYQDEKRSFPTTCLFLLGNGEWFGKWAEI